MKKTLLQEVKAMNKIAGTKMTKEQEIALIRERLQQLNELEFGTQKSFDAYNNQHKLRGDTKVTVAGKKMSVSQAAKQSKPAAGKGDSVFGKSTATAKPKKLSGSDLETSAEKDNEKPRFSGNHKIASDLYKKVLDKGHGKHDKGDWTDPSEFDDALEDVVKLSGHTPEQKKIKGAYKFTTQGHPDFEKLTPKQTQAVTSFLKAVDKKGSFDVFTDKWDGKNIVDADYFDDSNDYENQRNKGKLDPVAKPKSGSSLEDFQLSGDGGAIKHKDRDDWAKMQDKIRINKLQGSSKATNITNKFLEKKKYPFRVTDVQKNNLYGLKYTIK